jgi:hypothetical protein
MKIRTIVFALAVSCFSISPVALNAQAAASAHAETELEGKMDTLNGAFRKLRRQVTDATKNAESLKLVAEIKAASEESVKLIPAKAADLPEDERAAFVSAYQTKMKEFFAKLGELEAALKAGQNEQAAKIVAALGDLQKDGHKTFKKPEQKP